MYKLQLTRNYSSSATMGKAVLMLNGNDILGLHSLELPWKNNQKYLSCIDEGTYICRPYSSPNYSDVWQVMDVKDRSYILIHIGNYLKDTEGCILLGLERSGNSVLQSSKAINAMRAILKGEESFKLEIRS